MIVDVLNHHSRPVDVPRCQRDAHEIGKRGGKLHKTASPHLSSSLGSTERRLETRLNYAIYSTRRLRDNFLLLPASILHLSESVTERRLGILLTPVHVRRLEHHQAEPSPSLLVALAADFEALLELLRLVVGPVGPRFGTEEGSSEVGGELFVFGRAVGFKVLFGEEVVGRLFLLEQREGEEGEARQGAKAGSDRERARSTGNERKRLGNEPREQEPCRWEAATDERNLGLGSGHRC
jgi:hypothetical protein